MTSMASMASSTTSTTAQPRGPLSHIIDALRLDNRQQLLETLRHDPRLGDGGDVVNYNYNYHHPPGADSAAGHHGHGGAPLSADNNDSIPPPPPNASAAVQQQQQQQQQQLLIFGSADLRRTLLHQVMHHAHHRGMRDDDNINNAINNDTNNNKEVTKKKKKVGSKKSKNVTLIQEEEEIMKDWNEEMKHHHDHDHDNDDGGGCGMEIVGSSILSPLGDGTVISPYQHATTTTAANNNTNQTKSGTSKSTNPFGDDDDDDDNNNSIIDAAAAQGGDNNEHSAKNASIITYILRGGGFDVPSLSAAALHRRKVVAKLQSNKSSRSSSNMEKVFRFIFVPRMTSQECAFLKELGVVDDLNDAAAADTTSFANSNSGGATSLSIINSLESLPIDLIPLDDDVISLELTGGNGSRGGGIGGGNLMNVNESDKSGGGNVLVPPPSAACMRHSDIEGCEADVADIVARSLMKLQLLNRPSNALREGGGGGGGNKIMADIRNKDGAIGRVLGLGPLATAVIDRAMTLRLEEERLESQAEGDDDNGEDSEHPGEHVDEGMKMMMKSNVGVDGVEITANSNSHGQSAGGGHGSSEATSSNNPSIQALLVIDRKIDLVTPMLTPLTYEGLVDDVLQIQVGGCVSVKKSIVEPDDDDGITNQHMRQHPNSRSSEDDPTILVPLNDSDPLYTEVRDRHVETFGTFLQNQAKALKESHSQFTNRETARDLTEIHQFVKQIPVFTRNLRSLTNHIHIAELVKSAAEATSFRQRWQTERSMLESEACYEVLEDLIASGEPPYRWLRLFCLQSLTSNGIKATRYDSLRKEVVQTYGYEFLMILSDLEKAGFLRKRETFFMDSMATPYSTLRKALNLINADVDPSNPKDAAYVSSGYCPMTVRWVQAAMKGFVGLEEAIKELPTAAGVSGGDGGGRWIDIEQHSPAQSLVEALKRKRGGSLGALANKWADDSSGGVSEKPVLLVYFVGGVTFMELAALRFLSRRPSFPYSIVCCTTEIVNGGSLLRSLSC